MVWSEGGRASKAHSPELVVARVHSWALATIHELRWPFWLVIRVHQRVVIAVCGQWMVGVSVYGQWVVIVVGGGCEQLAMVVGSGGVGDEACSSPMGW